MEGTIDIMAREKTMINGDPQRSPSSLFCPCPVFSPGDLSDPRPPEEADVIAEMTKSQCLDTSVLDNDPATSHLLMQLFISDLTPEEELNKLGCVSSLTPPTSLDVDHENSVVSTASTPTSSLATVPQLPSPEPLIKSDSGASSEAPSPALISGVQTDGNTSFDDVISTLVLSASPLECNDISGFTDPLDNPFLTEFTDFSDFLQDPCVLNVSTMLTSTNNTVSSNNSSPSFSLNVSSEFCPSLSHVGSNTDAHSNVPDTHTQDNLNLFNLPQTSSIIPSFNATELENLDIDFSTFCADVSVMLTQAQPQPTPTTPGLEVSHDQPTTSSKSDVVFVESPTPSPAVSDQLSVQDHPVGSPVANTSQKRTASDVESNTDDSAPATTKKTKITRRQKNNMASQVSRAKRKAKNTAMLDRVSELESKNAMLRIQEKELTIEIERLKKLLVTRLSQ